MALTGNEPISASGLAAALGAQGGGGGITAFGDERIDSGEAEFGNFTISCGSGVSAFGAWGFYSDDFIYISQVAFTKSSSSSTPNGMKITTSKGTFADGPTNYIGFAFQNILESSGVTKMFFLTSESGNTVNVTFSTSGMSTSGKYYAKCGIALSLR